MYVTTYNKEKRLNNFSTSSLYVSQNTDMKLSHLKNIIKESIKQLITEQQTYPGITPFTNPGNFAGGGHWVVPTISAGGNGTIYLKCPAGYVFGPEGLSPDYNGNLRPMTDEDVIVPSTYTNTGTTVFDGMNGIRITKCRKLDLNYVAPPVNPGDKEPPRTTGGGLGIK